MELNILLYFLNFFFFLIFNQNNYINSLFFFYFKICVKNLSEDRIFSKIHVIFLKICIKTKMYKFARNILDNFIITTLDPANRKYLINFNKKNKLLYFQLIYYYLKVKIYQLIELSFYLYFYFINLNFFFFFLY